MPRKKPSSSTIRVVKGGPGGLSHIWHGSNPPSCWYSDRHWQISCQTHRRQTDRQALPLGKPGPNTPPCPLVVQHVCLPMCTGSLALQHVTTSPRHQDRWSSSYNQSPATGHRVPMSQSQRTCSLSRKTQPLGEPRGHIDTNSSSSKKLSFSSLALSGSSILPLPPHDGSFMR